MPRPLAPLALASVALLLAACGATPRYFFDDAFYAVPHGYRVRYASGGMERRQILTGNWLLVNWWGDPDGRPMELKPEAYGSWTLGDDRVVAREPTDDLWVENRDDGAVVWVRGVPLDETHADASVARLAQSYVERITAIAGFRVHLELPPPRYVETRVTQEGAATVGGADAWLVRFDIDPSRVHRPDVPSYRAELVLFRPARPWRPDVPHMVVDTHPQLVVACYVARVADFEHHRPDFESMLSRLDVAPAERR